MTLGLAGACDRGRRRREDDPENLLYLQLKDGRVVIRLRPDLAPKHVAQIKALAKQRFYDGIVFHRVIQASWRRPAIPPAPEPAAPSCRTSPPNSPTSRSSAARSAWRARSARIRPIRSSSSASRDASFLNGKYTVFGEVISGMEVVDKIKAANRRPINGKVDQPDKIILPYVSAPDAK